MCATCLSRTAGSGTSRPPVCTRGAQRRLPREARDGHDASPGRLHRWFTSFLVLQGHYTGGDRNAKSQPHAGPCCCPESDKRTSRGSQPVRGGVGAASGARPETAGGVGELQGGPERPAAHGHPTQPFLQTWRCVAAGHTGVLTPRLHTGETAWPLPLVTSRGSSRHDGMQYPPERHPQRCWEHREHAWPGGRT